MHEGKHDDVSIAAGADLSALQYHIINVSGTICVSDLTSLGVLQNTPESGENASIAWQGYMKAKAGGTITAGARLTVTTSGTLSVVSSGDTSGVVGKAMTAAASGALVAFIGNFANVSNVLNAT